MRLLWWLVDVYSLDLVGSEIGSAIIGSEPGCLISLSLCGESLSQNHNYETILSMLNLFGKPVSVFPVGCCGHAVMDCVWLTSQCKFVLSLCVTSFQVREVIVVGRGKFSGL
jgi:hypothetical protein